MKVSCRRPTPARQRWRNTVASPSAWPSHSATSVLQCRRNTHRGRRPTPRSMRRRSRNGSRARAWTTRTCAGTLDYCCRDDYGADASTVSAWAGLHYFASRHGFHAPGDEGGDRDGVLTWPEGNARLVHHLATPLGARWHAGCIATRVTTDRHGVSVDLWNEGEQRSERWSASQVVLALHCSSPRASLPSRVKRSRRAHRRCATRLGSSPTCSWIGRFSTGPAHHRRGTTSATAAPAWAM